MCLQPGARLFRGQFQTRHDNGRLYVLTGALQYLLGLFRRKPCLRRHYVPGAAAKFVGKCPHLHHAAGMNPAQPYHGNRAYHIEDEFGGGSGFQAGRTFYEFGADGDFDNYIRRKSSNLVTDNSRAEDSLLLGPFQCTLHIRRCA